MSTKKSLFGIYAAAVAIVATAWGWWTYAYYFLIPVHGRVLLTEEVLKSIHTMCDTSTQCFGLYSLFPFIQHTLTRVPFFAWYAVIFLLIFCVVLGISYLKTGRCAWSMTMKPWKVVALFVGMVWLLFMCLSFSSHNDLSFRTIVEPRSEVYKGAGPEALVALGKNYQELKDRGCLEYIGIFGGVAEASNVRMHCIQFAFVTRVVPQMVLILVLTLALITIGRLVMRRVFRLSLDHALIEFMMCLGVGIGSSIILLWLGALLGIYTALYGWGLLLALFVFARRDARYWINRFLHAEWELSERWHSGLVIVTWFLLSYLAFNFLNVIRPFPIGWDDLGSYLNRPRLLVSYGEFIHSMSSFQWEYLTSLGFLLFGYESIFGATAAMVINWFQGVIAILSVYLFGRIFMGAGRGILAATLYYVLPIVGHFSFADMKIDNAVFLGGALASFCLFYGLFYNNEDVKAQRKWVLLAGMFVGLAFSFKITAVMVFMALGAVLMGVSLHATAFLGSFFLICAAYIQDGTLNIPRVAEKLNYTDAPSAMLFFILFVLIGICCIGLGCVLRRRRVQPTFTLAAIFIAGFFIVCGPWLWHNSLLRGHILPTFAVSAPNTLTPSSDMFGDDSTQADYRLPPELAVDQSDPHCVSTAGTEELDRYWGNASGWGHYLKLPWRTVMNIDHAGYYVSSYPALFLFVLLPLLPVFWTSRKKYLRYLWVMTLFLVAQWAFLANGVPWYGIGMFFGLVLCLEALTTETMTPKISDSWIRGCSMLFIVISIFIAFGMRVWQFESQRNLFEYSIGKVSAETLRERTIPYYDDITDIVMERHRTMPDRPLLYRIGTFMPYFIPKNLEVIGVADHQLDSFNCMHQDRDHTKTLQRLKALGYNSIIFDTNTATIEKDPNGSLHQKVQALTDFLNSEEAGLEVIFYDPGAGIAFLLIP